MKHFIKDDDDDMFSAVDKVASHIRRESFDIKKEKGVRTHYSLQIDNDTANESVSSTLAQLLTRISSKFSGSLPHTLIGNIITSVVCSQTPDLQVALGVLLNLAQITHYAVCKISCVLFL